MTKTQTDMYRAELGELRLRTNMMDRLTGFGVLAVGTMLLFYALERRSPWFILAFAGSCVLSSVYGFLQGAWPFGVIEGIWSLVALKRWWLASETTRHRFLDRTKGRRQDCT